MRLIHLDSVGSTNDEAMALLRAGDPGGFVIIARQQTGGRGRQGRVWTSPPGNLYMSVALRDPAPPGLAPQLGFVAGVALAQTLRDRLAGTTRLRLKWPNDVLYDGAKLAGMLLESSTLSDGRFGCVIGVGVNCHSHPTGSAYPTTDLVTAGDADASPSSVLADFIPHFDIQLKQWKRGEGFGVVRAAWLAMAAGLGERTVVTTPRRRLEGFFRDIDATGRLELETLDGQVSVEAGDVFFPALTADTTPAWRQVSRTDDWRFAPQIRRKMMIMDETTDELVFVPLGGLGEIGMNMGLYGFGPKRAKKWLMVDCGISFAGPETAGIEIIVPDTSFIEKMRADLVAICITHAHEDHIGAVGTLWSRLRAPVYATRFAAGLLETKRLSERGAPDLPVTIVAQGSTIDLAPFSVEFIPVAHSVPESCALAIRTPLGTIVHTGDWKIDAAPGIGHRTDSTRFAAIGEEGVLALICDSTNILREGVSPSESEVAATLTEIIAKAEGRVLVTTFASNLARMRAVAEAAYAAGRQVILVGRSMDRVSAVGRDCGYLEGLPPFLSADAFSHVPREKCVVLATGSQGEPRAAIARISEDEHPAVALVPGDMVIFSSRTIPGNEREVNRIINNLVRMGIEVITDRTALIHASGHPRRGEVAQMYEWLRPTIAIPAHGEEVHLSEHYAFARERQVPHVIKARNGDVILLAPGEPGIVGEAAHGRMFKDGNILVKADDEAVRERQSLAFGGVVTIALAVTSKGDMAGTPDVVTNGLPAKTKSGQTMDALVDSVMFETFDNLPKQRRRDADTVSTAIERAVRSAVNQAWGKRPNVHVLVVEV